MSIKNLHRVDDDTVYARQCTECWAAWKIYQTPAHQEWCSVFGTPYITPDPYATLVQK